MPAATKTDRVLVREHEHGGKPYERVLEEMLREEATIEAVATRLRCSKRTIYRDLDDYGFKPGFLSPDGNFIEKSEKS